MRPAAVVISASEMPPASTAGLPTPSVVIAVNAADHARHGAEQPEQRRDRGDRAERIQVALEIVDDVPARVLDDFFHHFARRVTIREPRGEHLAERRALMDLLHLLDVDLVVLDRVPDLVRDVSAATRASLAGPKPFENDRDGDHGAGDDRRT